MEFGGWSIPLAPSEVTRSGQDVVPGSGHRARYWPVVLALSSVFLLSVFAMMTVSHVPLSNFWTYGAIGLTVIAPYLIWTHWLFRFDPWTPRSHDILILAVAWGSIPALVASVTAETGLFAFVAGLGQDRLGVMMMAPLAEEITKGAFIVVLFIFAPHHIRGPLDGLVLGALVGAGFGFAEDVSYLVVAFLTNGMTGLMVNYVMREIFTAHAHLLFTACTGLAAGIAVRHGLSKLRGLGLIAGGFIVALLLHVAWDTSSELIPSGSDLAILAPLLQGMVASVIVIAGLRTLRQSEDWVLSNALIEYRNAGWIDGSEAVAIADPQHRKKAVLATRGLPPQRREEIQSFYGVLTLLALNRARRFPDGKVGYAQKEEGRLLRLVTAERRATAQ